MFSAIMWNTCRQGRDDQARIKSLRLFLSVLRDLTSTNLIFEDILDLLCEFGDCRIVGPPCRFRIVLSIQVLVWVALTRLLPFSFTSVLCRKSRESSTRSDPDTEREISHSSIAVSGCLQHLTRESETNRCLIFIFHMSLQRKTRFIEVTSDTTSQGGYSLLRERRLIDSFQTSLKNP